VNEEAMVHWAGGGLLGKERKKKEKKKQKKKEKERIIF